MTPSRSLAPLLARYRAVAFDAYGVLADAAGARPGAAALLARLELEGRPAVIVTNDASRPPEAVAARVSAALAPDRAITAGLLAQELLAQRCPGEPVGLLGPEAAGEYLRRAGCRAVPLCEASRAELAALGAVCLMDESGFPWQPALDRLVDLLRRRPALPLVVPNPDPIYPRGDGTVGVATGALAALVEAASGCEALRLGKPAPALFERALARLRADLPDLAPAEVLFVGDTIATDIVGAARAGFATALVLSGNTAPERWRETVAAAPVRPDHVLGDALG